FQAEDGIRDSSVTGVQTCALPIYRDLEPVAHLAQHLVVGGLDLVQRDRRGVRAVQPHLALDGRGLEAGLVGVDQEAGDALVGERSEERRVGKEWRAGWSWDEEET